MGKPTPNKCLKMHPTVLLFVLLCAASFVQVAQGVTLKWCAVEGKERDGVTEKAKCEAMIAILNAETNDIDFECVERSDCADGSALEAGHAHLVALDGGDLYHTSRTWGAVPVLAENYDDSGTAAEYHTVVAMRASSCDDQTTLYSLKNKRACSTGYRKTAGWRMPIGMLMKKRVMPEINDLCDVNNDAESAAAFFQGMCSPGAPTGNDAIAETLCSSCKPASEQGENFCVKGADAYQGYDGALTCLEEGNGDVAFIKHTTIQDHTFRVGSAADYKLLCPQGGCMDPDQFELCKWATVPSHAVVVNPSRVGADVRQQLRMLFAGAQDLQPFKNLFFKTEAGSVVNPGDLIFKGSTMKLEMVDSDMISFMGPSYDVYEELEEAENKPCSAEVPVIVEDVTNIVKEVTGDDGIPTWGIIVIVVISVIAVAMLTLVLVMVKKERLGSPLFSPLIENPLSTAQRMNVMSCEK